MPTSLDILYVALFAIAMPLWDYLVLWPSFRLQMQVDPVRARTRIWPGGILYPWLVVAIVSMFWTANGRPWALLGFTIPEGWRLWVAIALVLLLALYFVQATLAVVRDPKAKESVRQQAKNIAELMPRTKADLYWFAGVSLTAGFCEEFLFRGYFVWALAPWLSWWGAAALSIVVFAFGHAYQGPTGIFSTGVVGTLFTLTAATFGSLWPAIALHFLLDLGMGIIAWRALRDDPSI